MPLSARSIFHQPALCHWHAAQSGSLACWLSLIKLTAGGLAAVSGHIFVSRYQKEMSGWVPAPARWALSWYNPLISFNLCAPWQLCLRLDIATFFHWHIVRQVSLLLFNSVLALIGVICANNLLFYHKFSFRASLGAYETEDSLLSHTSPVYRKSELCLLSENTSLNWNKKGFTQLFLSTSTPHRRQVISVSFMKSYTGKLQVWHNKTSGDLTEAWSAASGIHCMSFVIYCKGLKSFMVYARIKDIIRFKKFLKSANNQKFFIFIVVVIWLTYY